MTSPPRSDFRSPLAARALLGLVAPGHRRGDVLGDLEEYHRHQAARRGPLAAYLLTHLEALDLAVSILRERLARRVPDPGSPREAAAPDPLGSIGFSLLDFKLGFRMLLKHPGLTLVAGLAIAFAIALGAGTFEFVRGFLSPDLPFDGGDRIVEIRNQNLRTANVDPRASHDFLKWRAEVRTVEEIGAFRSFRRNLVNEQGRVRPTLGAEVSAAALQLPRVPPLFGRLIVDADEVPGAPMVFVLGHDVWQRHFGGDPEVVGKQARIGADQGVVVGVMPEGFAWPISHGVWMPLRLDPLAYEYGRGPAVTVAGRLAPGVTLTEARAELEAIGVATATDHPTTHEQLRPEVVGYGKVVIPMENVVVAATYSLNALAFAALILLVCGNVALLLFARTAARHGEIVVRTALGASRGRIVMQLLAEAMVLGVLAGLVGLGIAHVGLGWVMSVLNGFGEGAIGFWFSDGLTTGTIVYALFFTVLAAVVSGVVPALRITKRDVQPALQRAGAGGTGIEFGRLWSTVIVAQIAVTVAFVPIVVFLALSLAQIRTADHGFAADRFVSAQMVRDEEIRTLVDYVRDFEFHADSEDFRASWGEVGRRLADRADVPAVTFAGSVPGEYHDLRYFEIDGTSAPYRSARGHRHAINRVAPNFFEALGVRVLSGRDFRGSDIDSSDRIAVVNEAFVNEVLQGQGALGRRIFFNDTQGRLDDPERTRGPAYRIVGVVEQIAVILDPEASSDAAVYIPMGPDEEVSPVKLIARFSGDAAAFGPMVRNLASDVDPDLVIRDVRSVSESGWQAEAAYGTWFWIVLGAGGIALLLATAGIYAVMSFTVARRTREIGVRVALGADRRRIVWGVFHRALKQIALGVAIGGVIVSGAISFPELGHTWRPIHLVILSGYLLAMTAVCGLACIVPTRRALAIEPTEALRSEG